MPYVDSSPPQIGMHVRRNVIARGVSCAVWHADVAASHAAAARRHSLAVCRRAPSAVSAAEVADLRRSAAEVDAAAERARECVEPTAAVLSAHVTFAGAAADGRASPYDVEITRAARRSLGAVDAAAERVRKAVRSAERAADRARSAVSAAAAAARRAAGHTEEAAVA